MLQTNRQARVKTRVIDITLPIHLIEEIDNIADAWGMSSKCGHRLSSQSRFP